MDIPKKSLGQHWLHDDESLEAMIAAAGIGPEDTVLEIGPGLGTLTAKLVKTARQVIAVEFDESLARELPGRVPADNLTVVQQDILRFDLTQLPLNYKVAANIPYYLTSNLLRLLCESSNPFARASLLMQKEVAERVCARPGSMSLLAVSVQFYCETALDREVPAELFTPPPKVDSQILKLTRRMEPLYADIRTEDYFRVVKAGFAQRRKTMLNTLSATLRIDKVTISSWLERAGIAPSARAQTLDLEDWYHLAKVIPPQEH